KPANVMLTKGGAKLLDFGLAKLRPAPISGFSAAVTQDARPLTSRGSLLGTGGSGFVFPADSSSASILGGAARSSSAETVGRCTHGLLPGCTMRPLCPR